MSSMAEPLLADQADATKQPCRKLSVSDFQPNRTKDSSAWDRCATTFWLLGPVVLGIILGLFQNVEGEPCSGLPPAVERLSTIIGWIYFCAWSVSFYPQVYLNFRRKSVVGLSLDFQVLNMVGFTCYAIYNSAMYWNPSVRQAYALEHDGAVPAVHANDVFFSIHAVVLTAITLVQCYMHDRGGQVPSRISLVAAGVVTAVAVAYAGWLAVAGECVSACEKVPWFRYLSWLDWLYFLSFVKLGISLVKYIPQVLLNCKRRSTVGWNIWNVLLDFEGGMLSLAQLLMDCGVTKDWSPVTGNPVKFGLGFTSMFFDVIFMVQHYVLFAESSAGPSSPRSLPYPTEPACGNCGTLTCTCIAVLTAAPSHGYHPEHQHQQHHHHQQQQQAHLGSWQEEEGGAEAAAGRLPVSRPAVHAEHAEHDLEAQYEQLAAECAAAMAEAEEGAVAAEGATDEHSALLPRGDGK